MYRGSTTVSGRLLKLAGKLGDALCSTDLISQSASFRVDAKKSIAVAGLR